MAKNDFWENLAQLYHGIQNPVDQPMSPQVGSPQPGAPPGEPQHFEEGGYVADPEEAMRGSFGQGGTNYAMPNTATITTNPTSNPWYMDAAKGFAGSVVPSAGQAATAMLINRMFPSTPSKMLDTRQPEQQQAGAMGLNALSNLQRNPNSFGLPGDPNDVNTPAGQRLYGIKKGVRDADAARGSLNTGGSAQRETDAVNREIGSSYQTAQNSAFQNLNASSPPLHVQSRWDQQGIENPWSKILTDALATGIGKGLGGGQRDTNNKSVNPVTDRWFV